MNLVIYDWVSITSKIHSPQNFIEMLGLKAVTWETTKGMHGYLDRLYWNCISIYYNGRDDMGVWLEMTGQGCRGFETFGNGDYEALFDEVRENPNEMNLTRLDVAFDEKDGILDLAILEQDTRDKAYISRFRKVNIDWERNEESDVEGLSIYHGRKVSTVLIRIYNKAVERGFTDGLHWVRVELQLRDERALAFLDSPGTIGHRFCGVLRNYLRYVEEDDLDKNKWRWPMKTYWSRLLDGVMPIQLYSKPGAEYNLSNLENYVFKQCGGGIATLLDIIGWDRFMEGIRHRGTQLNPKYKALKAQYGVIQNEAAAARMRDAAAER